jgi:phage terminase Nu1 subunit (DNA packaging protein)
MAIPSTLSKSELGALLGLTVRRIDQLTDDEGVLRRDKRGNYPAAASVAAYVKHRERVVADRLGGPKSFTEARTAKMKAQAALAQIELLQRRGNLIEMDWVLHLITRTASNVKARLRAFPSRLAPRLAQKTAPEADEILRQEVHSLLHALAQFYQHAADELKAGRKGFAVAPDPESPPEDTAA